ncbi:MAG: hypothetical protein JXD22_10050 [Sedimentisphaerales bacterium]|nr:hypothetical protein [Sedimentisphaerales bacterium]
MMPGPIELIIIFAIGLPALILLIGGPIFLFVKGGKLGRTIVGVLALSLLFVFLMLFSFRPVSRNVAQNNLAPAPVDVVATDQPSNVVPAIWSEGLDDRFIADIYPSKASAARALGRQLPELFSSVLPATSIDVQPKSASDAPTESAPEKPARPTVIQIFSLTDDELLPTDTLHALADGIRQTNENLKVLVETAPPATLIEKTDPSAITIKVSCSKYSINHQLLHLSNGPQHGPFAGQLSGTISMEISGSTSQISRTIDFTEKPWSENYSDFVNQFPQHHWAIVRSHQACTSPNQATQQADNAARQYIIQKIRDQGMLKQNEPLTIALDDFVQDRFVQSLDGSAGRIWREAILLDISPEKLQKLNKSVHQTRTIHRRSLLAKTFSAAGLLVLICLVYLFLNAATKGYYLWSLRIAAVVIAAAIVILFLKFT